MVNSLVIERIPSHATHWPREESVVEFTRSIDIPALMAHREGSAPAFGRCVGRSSPADSHMKGGS